MEQRYILLLKAPPAEQVGAFVAENVSRQVPQVFAVDGDRVVGWCDIVPHGRETIRHVGELGMGVLKEYRGQGIGARLLRHCLDWAKEIGLERVELEVFASNLAAIELYKKFDFAIEGTKRRARKQAGSYEDIVVMGLLY